MTGMADERTPITLGAGALASLLAKLDEVMAEAARLRDEVSRQLSDQRRRQQQRITPPPSRRKPRTR
jgi:hypothetical protein